MVLTRDRILFILSRHFLLVVAAMRTEFHNE